MILEIGHRIRAQVLALTEVVITDSRSMGDAYDPWVGKPSGAEFLKPNSITGKRVSSVMISPEAKMAMLVAGGGIATGAGWPIAPADSLQVNDAVPSGRESV